jgi:hypothetical protein
MTNVFTHAGQRPRVLLEDPEASHQIVLAVGAPGNQLAVSCTCRARRGCPPFTMAPKLEPDEARVIWRRHLGVLESA